MIERLALVIHWLGSLCLLIAIFLWSDSSITNRHRVLFLVVDSGSCLAYQVHSHWQVRNIAVAKEIRLDVTKRDIRFRE